MPTTITITGYEETQRALKKLTGKVADGRKALISFKAYYAGDCIREWNGVKVTGGIYRGKKWAPMKPQYIRKTDGAVVEAWGGNPKIRGHGTVLGRKRTSAGKGRRPSGQRVKQQDEMMADTANMRKSFLGVEEFQPLLLNKTTLELGPHGVSSDYAEVQHKLRPFVFWQLPKDQNALQRRWVHEIDEVVKEFNRTTTAA